MTIGIVGYGAFCDLLARQPDTKFIEAEDGVELAEWVYTNDLTRVLFCGWETSCVGPKEFVDKNCRPIIYLPNSLYLVGYVSPLKIYEKLYTFDKAILGAENLIKGHKRFSIYRINHQENLGSDIAARIVRHFSTTNAKSITMNCRNFV